MSLLALTFDKADASAFSAVECHDVSAQLSYLATGRRGKPSARMLVRPGDTFGGAPGTRCLCARYDTGEADGQEWWYRVSFQMPNNDGLIWELHHQSDLYNLSQLGVAPHALIRHQGQLKCRLAAGDGVIGQGWPVWYPANVLLSVPPVNQWVDVLVHIGFAKSNGLVEYWVDATGQQAFPASPTWSKSGVATIPYCTAAGVGSPKPLYTEVGWYGSAGTDTVILHDGSVRGSTREEVLGFYGAQPAADPLGLGITALTSTVVTLGWTPPSAQAGFVPLLDGADVLTDGKRHPSLSPSANSVRIGRPQDGKQHRYGVRILQADVQSEVTA
jgi:hypothetical protein